MKMIAFVVISPKEGISKKIVNQACAMSMINGTCELYCLDEENNLQVIICKNGFVVGYNSLEKLDLNMKAFNRVDPFIRSLESKVGFMPDEIVYIRHMIPSLFYISFLKRVKAKIIVEIPTYPYFYEQMAASHNKIGTGVRIAYETVFWPLIYKQINKIVAIPCRMKAKRYRKMQFVTNGFCKPDNNLYSPKDNNNALSLTLIGVGTIQKYHGYEKIIEALHEYTGDLNVKFYIVGNGDVDYLKQLVTKYDLEEKVVFTGLKTGEDLEKLYREADIGVGTMALELRRADIDTGIKVLDYYTHGLPVISSGLCPDVNEVKKPYMIIKDRINIDMLNNWRLDFDEDCRKKLSMISSDQYSWERIMEKILNE